MSKQIKNKCIHLFLLLFTFLLILSSNTVFADGDTPTNDLPNVVSYRMISPDKYIKWSTEHENIGIIVEFDTLEDVVVTTSDAIYAEINMIMEGGPNGCIPARAILVDDITLSDGHKYKPENNELLFLFEYLRGMYFLDANNNVNQPGDNNNEPYLLKVENIVLNGNDISVNTKPIQDYRVYYDEILPEFIDSVNNIEITSTEESYQYQEKLTMDLHFDEPVKILDNENSIKFCIHPKDDDEEVIVSFDDITGSGTKDISVSYTFDEELRADYIGDINIIIDETLVTDIAGNELTIPYNSEGYFDVFHDNDNDENKDNVIIKSIYPFVTQEDESPDESYIYIRFTDDDTIYDDLNHLTNNWEVGIFLSENEIDDLKKIEYKNYPLLDQNGSGTKFSHLVYKADEGNYRVSIKTLDDAFDDANDKDQEWYFYYYIKDADGNKIFGGIPNVNIDRAPPEINISGNYLTPSTNQAIQFEITDSCITEFYILITDLNDNNICDMLYNLEEGFDIVGHPEHFNYLNLESTTYSSIVAGAIDVEGMVEYINSLLEDPNNQGTLAAISLNTDTYKLIIQSNDDLNRNVISEENVLFTIDKTPPTVDIETTEGDAGTISSYKLTFSDKNGKKAITDSNLIYDDDNEITLYYEFVKAGKLSYPEAQNNYKKVHTGNEVIIDVPYGGLTSGTYCLNIKGVDRAGNIVTEVSTDTFAVPDPPIGTMSCDKFSNDLTLNVNCTVTSTYDNLEYRVCLDNNDADTWTDWKILDHTSGTGTLPLNLDDFLKQGEQDSLEQGNHKIYIQYRFTLNNAYFESDIVCDSFIYDTQGPTATVQYSTEELTYEPVTATLVKIADKYTKTEDIKVSLEGMEGSEGTKEVTLNTANDKITFVLEDKAGNVSKYVAHAPLISSDAKPAKVIYSTTDKTTHDITVHLEFDAMDDDKASITVKDGNPLITSEGGIYYYTFEENGNYNFEYVDDINRTGHITAYIHNIDRTNPTAEISYNFTQLTNNDVYGYINPSETVDYEIYDETTSGGSIDPIVTGQSINGELIKYTFTDNGEVKVLLKDEAGNDSIYNLSVDWIDKTPPEITVEYSDNYYDEKTRDDITATISAIEAINILNNNEKPTRVFTENGDYIFMVEDKAGNHVDVDIKISNIDKSEPVIELDYSTKEPTKEDVTVTLTADVPITILNNGGSNKLTFKENGRKYLQYKDDYEREYLIFVDVNNIDKQPPEMKFDKYKDIFTQVGGDIDLDEGFSIFDNVDGEITNYTIDDDVNLNEEGTYEVEYTFTDTAGNTVTVKRNVEVISDLTLVINGQKGTNNLLMLDGLDLDVHVYNAKGSYQVQYKKGILRTGKFKKNKQLIKNGKATLNEGGYVTFYVQDQERNWKLVRSYIYE